MLIVLMMNLQMFGPPTPPTPGHGTVEAVLEEKGGYDGKKIEENAKRNKIIQADDEEILLLIAQWIAQQNSN